jgi:hypothetical protein
MEEGKEVEGRIAGEMIKGKSFRIEIDEYQKTLVTHSLIKEILKRDTKHLIQINQAEETQQKKMGQVSLIADYQYRKVQD